MERKVSLLFLCATFAWCAAATMALGQAPEARLKAYTTVNPRGAAPRQDVPGSPQLPEWTFAVTSSRGHNAHFTGVMVGRDPFGNESNKTANVPTQIVPIIFTTNLIGTSVASDGTISTTPGVTNLDPTVTTPCLTAPNNVPLRLYQQSPIIQKTNFNFGGTEIGVTQYEDAFQQANFWEYTKGKDYHMFLHPVTTTKPVYVNVPAADGLALATTALGGDFCAPLGIVDINWFDAYLDDTILPSLYSQGVNPGSLPIILMANTVLASPVTDLGSCCVLGYHSYEGVPTQTYGVIDFDTTGLFGPTIFDTSISAHEVGEWMNDPYGDNLVPPWGHIGQQPGCQDNLEVGDPLTGTDIPTVTMPNGYAYHLQELVFFSWFFGAPPIGVNGWFSDNGTFTTDAGAICN